MIAFLLFLSLSLFRTFSFSDTAYVRVFISDVNDNKPAFAQVSYEVDVDEDADVGFAVLTVSANDGDEGGCPWVCAPCNGAMDVEEGPCSPSPCGENLSPHRL